MKIFVHYNYFLSGKHRWKAVKSHLSLLTLFRINFFAIECIFNTSHDHEFSWFFKIIIQLKVGMEPPKFSNKSIKQSARFVSQTASLSLKSPPPAPPSPKQKQSHSFLDVVYIKDRSLFIAGGEDFGRVKIKFTLSPINLCNDLMIPVISSKLAVSFL